MRKTFKILFGTVLVSMTFAIAHAQSPAAQRTPSTTVTSTTDWAAWKHDCSDLGHYLSRKALVKTFLACGTDTFRARPFHFSLPKPSFQAAAWAVAESTQRISVTETGKASCSFEACLQFVSLAMPTPGLPRNVPPSEVGTLALGTSQLSFSAATGSCRE